MSGFPHKTSIAAVPELGLAWIMLFSRGLQCLVVITNFSVVDRCRRKPAVR